MEVAAGTGCDDDDDDDDGDDDDDDDDDDDLVLYGNGLCYRCIRVHVHGLCIAVSRRCLVCTAHTHRNCTHTPPVCVAVRFKTTLIPRFSFIPLFLH